MYADIIEAEARARIDAMLEEAAAHRLLSPKSAQEGTTPFVTRVRRTVARTLFELAERVAVGA
jgi:hypothetical protein